MVNEQVATNEEIAAISKGIAEVLNRARPIHSVPLTDWVPMLLGRIEDDAKRIAELERVTGPMMPCGRYAVQHSRYQASGVTVLTVYCPGDADVDEEEITHDVTPEYTAWKESQ